MQKRSRNFFGLAVSILLVVSFLVFLCPAISRAQPVSPVFPPGSLPICSTNPSAPTTLTARRGCILDNGSVYYGDSTGTAVAVGSGGAGTITSVFDCTSGSCQQLTGDGTDTIDFTGTTLGASTGIGLPQGTTCTPVTGGGFVCWNTNNSSLWVGDSTAARRMDTRSQPAVTLTLADATPEVSKWNTFYDCADTTTITDFVDADGDHSDFSEDFHIVITAQTGCTLAFSSGSLQGNGETDWTAAAGDVAECWFSSSADNWTCDVTSPAAVNTMTQETTAILAPALPTIDWVRVCGDASCVAVGSTDGTTFAWDLDDDQAADCTLTKSGGESTFSCSNTNVVLQPGQTNGDIKFNNGGGTEALEYDPDINTWTITAAAPMDFNGKVTSKVYHDDDTANTEITLGASECHGGYHKNADADAINYTLPDGETGGGQMCCFEDRAGGIITVDVNDVAEVITLSNGTALTAGNAVDLSAGIGNGFCIFSDSATAWHILPGAVGTIADGGAD